MAPNSNNESKSSLLTELEENVKTDTFESPHPDPKEEEEEDTKEDETLKLSLRQMYIDTLQLDWSKVLWDMVFSLVVFHVIAFYGLYLCFTFQFKWQSGVFTFFYAYAGGLGITMGTHRLWTHRAFAAHWAVRVCLMCMNCIAFQESIYLWSQNHRVHHKWSDTDRDFTNSRRGFFFAHMGWKMYQTHPEVIKGRKMVDCSDLLGDPVVKFQHDYYYYVALPICFVIPTLLPMYFWNETFIVAFTLCTCARLAITFHSTWCINSVAHLYGYKPYDKSLYAFENKILGPFALGEGWHNYHHAFPRDYRASEIDGWGQNVTTKIIEFLNRFNLTTDLKTVSDEHIDRRTERTGDVELRERAKSDVY
uniref:Delta(9)-fatty-acid desaturase fat-7-like n=2 Tax=Hirondellea gigas TaxID=1518452 RepID=A0A6A7G5A3_9CRUS